MERTEGETQRLLLEALMKKAQGYTCTECTDEYTFEEGVFTPLKRKQVTRDVPPDVAAIKLLLEGEREPEYTEQELERELKRYLTMLKNTVKKDKEE